MAQIVTGEESLKIANKLAEINRQLYLQKEYPYDVGALMVHLQAAIEGRFLGNGNVVMDQSDQKFNFWLSRTVEFYQKFMDLDISSDLNDLISTRNLSVTRPKGFNWPLFIPANLTARQAMDKLCKPQFKTYESRPLEDYTVITEERSITKSRLILCRNTGTECPDKEWLGKSADFMSATPTKFLDLTERIVLQALHFFITNQHLDIKGWTRIPRVRTADGWIADVYWSPGFQDFRVYWSYPGYSFSVTGGREAVVYT